MGLTIHYSLNAGIRPLREVRRTVAALRARAAALSFVSVSPVIELAGDDCFISDQKDPHFWLKVQAICSRRPRHPTDLSGIHPHRIIAFSIDPARGSEQANFGFCQRPCAAGAPGRRARPGRRPWSWASFCKTQYASNPTLGGMENFLQAHLGIVRLLDYAQELGVLAYVQDEGRYWERRSVPDLVREVGQWNQMIAAGYGVMRDAIEAGGGNPKQLQAEIAKFSDFERLEAKGRLR